MQSQEITIVNKLGLHARAAAKFVTRASGFDSKIHLERGGHKADAKSILAVMMLAASRGTLLTLRAEGEDEVEAMRALVELVEQRFGESE